MKTSMLRAAIALTMLTFLQAAVWGAGDIAFASAGDEPGPAGGNATAPTTPGACYGECGAPGCGADPCGCSGGTRYGGQFGGGAPTCDERPHLGIIGLAGFDTFRGVSDGTSRANFGFTTGVNGGVPMPWASQAGFGLQLGATYGLYDLDGQAGVAGSRLASQQQTFVTAGVFRKGYCGRPWSFGLVYDWMFNDNWGFFSTTPTFGQWRGQIEYAVSNRDAFGVWGTFWDRIDRRTVGTTILAARSIDQINIFWHHKFALAADGRIWIGIPERQRLDGTEGGSLGEWIIGGDLQVPVSRQLALYVNVQYMRPSVSAGAVAANENSYNIGVGLAWYFGGHARSRNINGHCWTPYLPVANNSNFLVDQSISGVVAGPM